METIYFKPLLTFSRTLAWRSLGYGRIVFQLFIYLFLLKFSDLAGKRRRKLELFAKQAGFDPLQPENWYMQSEGQILAAEVHREAFTKVF